MKATQANMEDTDTEQGHPEQEKDSNWSVSEGVLYHMNRYLDMK